MDAKQRRLQASKQSFTGVGNSAPQLGSMTEGVPVYAMLGKHLYEFIRVKNRVFKRKFENDTVSASGSGLEVTYSSWTPALSVGTATTVRGELTAIGNFRISWFNIVFASITSSATMVITGIPDVPDGVFPAYGPSVFTSGWTGLPLNILWSTSNSGIVFSNGGVAYLTGTQCSSKTFRALMFYSVA